MSHSKTKKNLSAQWYQCDKCHSYITHKDIELHGAMCPPDLENLGHTFVLDGVLFGLLDLKPCEEVKNLSSREKDSMLFISQAAMQLCEFAIGDLVVLESRGRSTPLVLKVWPTIEKGLTSVLITRNCLENANLTQNDFVIVKRFIETEVKAMQISVVILNGPKSLELTSELSNRLSKSYEGRYVTTDNIAHIMFYGTRLKFAIKVIKPKNECKSIEEQIKDLCLTDQRMFYLIDSNTKWQIFKTQESFNEANKVTKKQEIVGQQLEIDEILEIIKAISQKSKCLTVAGNKSVLLYGHSGTGKTTIAEMIGKKIGFNTVKISAANLYGSTIKAPEDAIRELFQESIEKAPSILILDEIDILCPSRSGRISDSEKRLVSTLLTCIDSLKQSPEVFVIATTNKLDNIDLAFRRCGRLDREIEILTPNPKTRKLILENLIIPQSLSNSELQELALSTHGYVGADLVSLCSQANLICARRGGDKTDLNDFKLALRKVKPSAMREVQIEVPNVKWSDIGGQNDLKLLLRQAVEWPLIYPESFTRLGITPPKGVLMFGPPGCSKTMIAKALATESGLNFLSIKGPELFSKWVGESEKAVRDVFNKARQVAPSIVFFDEIDALGGERGAGASTSVQERVLAQLLTELDGITPLSDVTIVAATNRPDKIDKALLRPGRLDRIVYVQLPDDETRSEIFRIKLSKIPTRDVDINNLVTSTKGYSGAEVNAVCHEAAMFALEEDLQSAFVETRHFAKALMMVTPRTPQNLLKIYEDYINIKI
ncbi:ATPase family gene 2 protein homolog A isoform X2 [Euwallacea fornicatus]|uniref:ATPase family gene 2 protein homolog A isoform X2 n=1 Tax=Euwallacea fornicatus TaxID=995702 RepID=UPI0033902FE3